MKTTFRRNSAGFTLIEILVVLGILGVVMAAIYSLYSVQQRSAYTEEETVDVQQNLRIAMESLSRDIRMAGFMIRLDANPGLPNFSGAYTDQMPVGFFENNVGPFSAALDPVDRIASDRIVLNQASAAGVYSWVNEAGSVVAVGGADMTFTVDSNDYFSTQQTARIISPMTRNQPVNAIFTVTGVGNSAAACAPHPDPCLTLQPNVGGGGAIVAGNLIFRISSSNPNTPYPETILYRLVDNATVDACPNITGQLCLAREVNAVPPVPGVTADIQIVATNMAGLQFRYLLADGTESDNPPDLEKIRAVRVTLWGVTVSTRTYTGGIAKIRSMSTVIKMRNRSGA